MEDTWLDRPEVFCQDCDWYRGTMHTGYRCAHPHAKYMVKTPLGMVPERHTAEERNALNDCADFQPRRFWLALWRSQGALTSLIVGLWVMLYTLLWLWGSSRWLWLWGSSR